MKFLNLFYFFILFSTKNNAQSCQEVIDPITNEKSVEYKFEHKIHSVVLPWYTIKYEVKNKAATLTKEFTYGQLMKTSAPIGTEVYFKLENGTILKLKTNKEALPQVTTNGGLATTYKFIFNLTKEQLSSLSQSSLVLIRLPKLVEEGFNDIDEKEDVIKKNKKPLKKGAECIITYL